MFYGIFRQLCKDKGVSDSKACLDMGLSRSLAAKWKITGDNPSAEVLNKMADYFGVSVDYLMGRAEKEKPVSETEDGRCKTKYEVMLDQMIPQLSEEHLKLLLALAEAQLKQQNDQKHYSDSQE